MKKQFKKNIKAVSPVIGALMLTVITVAAAGSFAVFVSQRQEIIQDQKMLETRKEVENIIITNIQPSYNPDLNSIIIDIKNLHDGISTIGSVSINNQEILEIYNDEIPDFEGVVFPFQTDSYENETFRLTSFNPTIDGNTPITIDVLTLLGNQFSKTFYPPTSIIKVETKSYWDSSTSNFIEYNILDGSTSDHPGEGYITKWTWRVEDTTNPGVDILLNPDGRIIRPVLSSGSLNDGNTYEITLTVKDNYGMTGSSMITYP